MLAAASQKDVFDSTPEQTGADLNAMFDDINSLPANDPLRAVATASVTPAGDAPTPLAAKPAVVETLSEKVLAKFRNSAPDDAMRGAEDAKVTAPKVVPVAQTPRQWRRGHRCGTARGGAII